MLTNKACAPHCVSLCRSHRSRPKNKDYSTIIDSSEWEEGTKAEAVRFSFRKEGKRTSVEVKRFHLETLPIAARIARGFRRQLSAQGAPKAARLPCQLIADILGEVFQYGHKADAASRCTSFGPASHRSIGQRALEVYTIHNRQQGFGTLSSRPG